MTMFLQRDSVACLGCINYDRFRLSVKLSATVRYQVKMTQATIMRSSLKIALWLYSFLVINFTTIFEMGHTGSWGAECERGRKIGKIFSL